MLGLDLRGSEFSYESRFHTKGLHQTTSDMGLSSRKKLLCINKGLFPNRNLHSGHCPADVIVVVEVEQQHTMWQVEWQWPRESAFSHPDPPVTPSSCPLSAGMLGGKKVLRPHSRAALPLTQAAARVSWLQSKAGSSSAKQARPSECDTGLQIAAAESYWIMAYFTGNNAKSQTIQKRYARGHQTFAMK